MPVDCQADAMFVINREKRGEEIKQFFNSSRGWGKEIEGESQVAASQQSVSQTGSGEKNRNEGRGLTNYIVNKINRENKNVRTMKVEAYLLSSFDGGRNTCLFYSVEFDSLQQITTSRSKKEKIMFQRAETFLSFFFSFSFSFFFFFGWKDRSSVQFLVSTQLLQLYVHARNMCVHSIWS